MTRRRGPEGARAAFAAAATFAVAFVAGASCSPRTTVDRIGVIREAESTLRDGSGAPIESAWCASSGRAVRIDRGAAVELVDVVGSDDDALWLRVACVGGGEVSIAPAGGGPALRVAIPDTLHRERFEWIRAVGAVGAGATLERDGGLRVVAERGDVLLDQWALLASRLPAPLPWSPRVWRSDGGAIELRAAARAQVVDPEWPMQVAREQRDVVADRFGAKLRRPLVLIALPAGEWSRPGAGAFQNGCAIFLRDDELHLPWRSYAHEIAHLFEEERPAKLPWFLSEGIACALALEVERAILGAAAVAEKEGALDRLLVEGDALHRPGSRAANPMFALAADPPDEAARASAYAWSTAFLREVVRRGGAASWRRIHEGLAAERGEVGLVDAGRILRDAAQVPIDDLLLRIGWPQADRG